MSREMKDSGIEWIGEIPSHWKRTKLLNLLRQPICDGPHETPNLLDDGIPFISVDSLNNTENVDLSKCKKFISVQDYERYREKANLEKNDVLFTKAATIGKTAIVGDEVFMVWSPIAIIKTNEFISYYKYVYHTLNCYELIKYISLLGSFNTQINVGMRELEKAIVPLPPLSEQIAIADFLDKKCAEIDSVIEQTKATIEEYKKLKQSIITEAVTKGIRGDRPMKDSGIEWIGEIPREWNVAKVKNGVTKVGSGKTPLGGVESYADKGILFLRSQNIYDTGLVLESPTYITAEVDEEMKGTRVFPRDVLLNITGGSIGRCCIFPQECVRANVNQHVSIIRVIDSVFLAEYMHYFWISSLGQTAIDLYQTGGNREGMSADAIKNTPIPIMSIEEQHEIISYLDKKCIEMDSLIEKKTALLEEMEALKKSIIFEYVTGKKEVV